MLLNRCSFDRVSPLSLASSALGMKGLLGSGMWSRKMPASFCSSVAPASLITTSVIPASLPSHPLTCAGVAKVGAILFLPTSHPGPHHGHPDHLPKEALPEAQSRALPSVPFVFPSSPSSVVPRVHIVLSQALGTGLTLQSWGRSEPGQVIRSW